VGIKANVTLVTANTLNEPEERKKTSLRCLGGTGMGVQRWVDTGWRGRSCRGKLWEADGRIAGLEGGRFIDVHEGRELCFAGRKPIVSDDTGKKPSCW